MRLDDLDMGTAHRAVAVALFGEEALLPTKMVKPMFINIARKLVAFEWDKMGRSWKRRRTMTEKTSTQLEEELKSLCRAVSSPSSKSNALFRAR